MTEARNEAQELRDAAARGDAGAVRSLLGRGAGVDGADEWNRTPLYLAARGGHTEVVRLLVQGGAALHVRTYGDPDAESEELAGRPGNKEIMARATTVTTSRGSSCTKIDDAIVWVELQRRGEFPSWSGQSPMIVAARKGHASALAVLLDAGADANGPGDLKTTPLIVATRAGQVESVRMLLAAGADPNTADMLQALPLFYAIEAEDDALQALLGPVTRTDHDLGAVALVAAARRGQVDRIGRLLAAGVPVDARDHSRGTALFQAIKYDHPAAARALVAAGADMQAYDHPDAARVLALVGPDAEGRGFYTTAVMLCCKCRRLEILSDFIAAGLTLSATARDELMEKARRWKSKAVVALLKKVPVSG